MTKTVAVIGAGVSGLTTAKRLRAEGLHVRVFERASSPGGVWLYSADANAPFASPMYDPLETNYPRDLMKFADHPWPDNAPLYPSHQQVLDYLQSYGKGVGVEYGTEVLDVFKRTGIHPHRWRVTIEKVKVEEKPTSLDFDAVVVCIGTFDKPFMPDDPGLVEWGKAFPNSVLHSKAFRDFESYQSKACANVVVIGNGPSGQDISSQLARKAKTVWVSTRDERNKLSSPNMKTVGPIEKFNTKHRSIELKDGTSLMNVDKVIYCTGYEYSHQFLRKGVRAKTALHDDGFHVDDLWQHMFWIDEPMLIYIGIPKEGPTFLTSQSQAAYAARCLAGRSFLPFKTVMGSEMMADLEKRATQNLNIETKAHTLGYPECKMYIEALEMRCKNDAAALQRPITDGNKPFRWTERIEWIMANRGEIGKRYKKKDCLRKNYPTPESLGFEGVPKKSNTINQSCGTAMTDGAQCSKGYYPAVRSLRPRGY
ncbi:thiol-specific monooxygenase [Apiospora arundinis]|uniref:Thiol-specific monooxygenase n=1 Tax=Apiospora arundinis TaxID=335852 RepID=A0ABR2IA33_9PEZI